MCKWNQLGGCIKTQCRPNYFVTDYGHWQQAFNLIKTFEYCPYCSEKVGFSDGMLVLLGLKEPILTDAEKKVEELYNLSKSREWNYYFKEGMKCQINEGLYYYESSDCISPSVIDTDGKYIDMKKYIDMEGEVIDCWSDLHAFAFGSAYSCKVKFENNDEVIFVSCGILDGGITY